MWVDYITQLNATVATAAAPSAEGASYRATEWPLKLFHPQRHTNLHPFNE